MNGDGPGGGGRKLQSTDGFVNTGPVVVWLNEAALEYVHSNDTIDPGADDVLALNVQFNVAPLLAISQVSDSFGPVTPNLATAVAAFAMVTVADFVTPAYVAVIVADAAPDPAFAENENVALDAPALTTTVVGTLTDVSPVRVTAAPFDGAGDVSVTVPLLPVPSVTVASASERLASAAVDVGVGGFGLGVVGVEERPHCTVASNATNRQSRAINFMTADEINVDAS